jgi:hypothetical protein
LEWVEAEEDDENAEDGCFPDRGSSRELSSIKEALTLMSLPFEYSSNMLLVAQLVKKCPIAHAARKCVIGR